MSSLSLLEKELSCSVCLDIYKDPVILSCRHTFCKACLEQWWAGKDVKECPTCKQHSSKELFVPSLTLRNKCESYKQRMYEIDSTSQDVLCSVHSEKLNLFCLDDEKLVCMQCVSQNHQNHSFSSISKAIGPHKEEIATGLRKLQSKLDTFSKVKLISEEMAAHIKSQASKTEKQIQVEFEKLHQFLRDEEQARITALREEEEEKRQRMRKKIDDLDNHIEEIKDRILEIEDKQKNDALIFVDLYRILERAQYRVADPEPDSGALINVAKHVGNLRHRVWKKMKELCPYFPVILDPNTAHHSIILSEDLDRISNSNEKYELPDNPERMSAYLGVLGSEGFRSGTHSWTVDVGESESWIVGVAEKSVNRKKSCGALPRNGFFCIWRSSDKIFTGTSQNSVKILVTKPNIKKIGVTINYEKGQVILSNLEDNVDLCNFAYTFTKEMYPYFYNQSKNCLKILPP